MTYKLKPILNDEDHSEAMKEFARLWGAEDGTPEGDLLSVLAVLIEKYDDEHFAMSVPDPIDAILFRMEQQGLTRKDLEPMIGPRNRVSEVLNRKRNLSIDMIRSLHEKLGISAEVLIQPVKIPA
jgi:HTH-type transcriptional regulator/antitoxin HigA